MSHILPECICEGYVNYETRSGVCGLDAYRWKPDIESAHDVLPWLDVPAGPRKSESRGQSERVT